MGSSRPSYSGPMTFKSESPTTSLTADQDKGSHGILSLLGSVIDPETGINIVDMGLIYAASRNDTEITVLMTMTSAACPVGDMLVEDVERCLRANYPEPTTITVTLTFDPPWEPARMSAAARDQFGW